MKVLQCVYHNEPQLSSLFIPNSLLTLNAALCHEEKEPARRQNLKCSIKSSLFILSLGYLWNRLGMIEFLDVIEKLRLGSERLVASYTFKLRSGLV